jgi:hypothetical protein
MVRNQLKPRGGYVSLVKKLVVFYHHGTVPSPDQLRRRLSDVSELFVPKLGPGRPAPGMLSGAARSFAFQNSNRFILSSTT